MHGTYSKTVLFHIARKKFKGIFKRMKLFVMAMLCVVYVHIGYAQHQDTSFSKSSGFVVPIAYYTTETSLALGLGGIAYYNFGDDRTETRPSSAYFFATYTLNKQWIIDLPYHLFSNKEEWYVNGEIAFYDFPFKFYGIGCDIDPEKHESYHLEQFRAYTTVYKKVKGAWYVGPRLWQDHFGDIRFDPMGELSMLQIQGKHGGNSTGIGASILYDSRRNVYCPKGGWYLEASYLNYAIKQLNNNKFHNIRIEARNYLRLHEKTVLATNFFGSFNMGDVPFYMLSEFGGLFKMRGYYRGSFRDKNVMLLQSELRQDIVGRFGMAVFGGVATVFGDGKMKSDDLFKPSYGIGLRCKINRKEDIPLRADLGMGGGFHGSYITTGEAF